MIRASVRRVLLSRRSSFRRRKRSAQSQQNLHLPHHKLLASTASRWSFQAVRDAKIRDSYLRDHAMRAAKSACLNTAWRARGALSRADKGARSPSRVARRDEAAACVEIAVRAGDAEGGLLDACCCCQHGSCRSLRRAHDGVDLAEQFAGSRVTATRSPASLSAAARGASASAANRHATRSASPRPRQPTASMASARSTCADRARAASCWRCRSEPPDAARITR